MQKKVDQQIEELFTSHYQSYYRLAYSYVKNEQDAMDVVQESAYKAIQHSRKLKQEEFISSWIYRIVINTSLDLLRKKQRTEVGIPDDYEAETFDIHEDFDITASLNKLNDLDKTIIKLRFFEDLKLKEIAQILNENENMIKSRLYRSLKQLRIELGGEL